MGGLPPEARSMAPRPKVHWATYLHRTLCGISRRYRFYWDGFTSDGGWIHLWPPCKQDALKPGRKRPPTVTCKRCRRLAGLPDLPLPRTMMERIARDLERPHSLLSPVKRRRR